nr:hypothetical protein OG296_34265 [Streptomyces sp. NBC_01001]
MADVAESPADAEDGGASVELGGYRQELKRTLGSFQVFAISFAFISVAVGIFATYDDVLVTAGPVGIWLWIIAAAGQTLVALVVAQFAARIPLSGSSYQWASPRSSASIPPRTWPRKPRIPSAPSRARSWDRSWRPGSWAWSS